MKKLKGICSLFICILILTLVVGCGNNSDNNSSSGSITASGTNNSSSGSNSSSSSQVSTKELEKNVETYGAVSKHDKLIVFVKNNNKVAVDMEIEVEFYDKDGNIVGSDADDLKAVGSNSEVAVEMWDTPSSWDNYKLYVDLEQTDEICYFDKVTLTHSNTGEQIAAQVKNNSEDTIEYIKVAVVYYQGDEVVGIDDGIESDIKPGRSANFNLDFPYDSKYNKVRFDTYKVFITGAYSYNW